MPTEWPLTNCDCRHDPWTNHGRWRFGCNLCGGVCVRCGELVVVKSWGRASAMTDVQILAMHRLHPDYWAEMQREQSCVRRSLISMPEWIQCGFSITVPDLIVAFGK